MTNSFFKTITARPVSNTFRILQILFLVLAQVGGAFYGVQPALAAPIVVVDDAGPDDEPGQKDLNALTVDYGAPGATTISVKWNWDNTTTSGANTRDGGALFDTDGDGFANYSLYVTVATDGTWITQLFICTADSASDRCAGPTLDPTFSSTATVSTVANSDPFAGDSSHTTGNTCSTNPACYTDDTVADTTIVLSDFGNPADVSLLNVCSYPSGQPNSDPSDCVFEPNSGFLTIVKVADPDDSTDFVFNASEASASGDTSWTITGSGSVDLISYESTTLDLNEVIPNGWQLDSASCEIQSATPAPTGTETATGVVGVTIQSGLETICTFNDSLAAGTLTLIKEVDNLGESGPGYLGVDDFPLSIDGNATTSGTSVSVTAGNHTIAEESQPGYSVGTWECSDGTTGNAGEVSATVNIGGGENVTCTMTNTLIAAPELTLDKTADPQTYDAVNDVISYSYLVENTGNVSLAGPVTIDDDIATDEVCPDVSTVGDLDGFLDPGEQITCTASYTITQADLDAGSVTNVATASADGTTSNQDTETVDADQNPELTLDKTADPQTYDAVNDVISYSYLVENTGNVSLAGPVTIDDDIATDEVCPDVNTVGDLDGFLDPGEQITCTASYTITQADLDAGSVTNVATASADGTTSNQDTETVDADQNPELTLDKTADPQTYDAVNDVISYSYLVENTGNVSLAGPVTIDDDIATDEVCPDVSTVGDLDGFLDPGEQITCTASYTITQADLDAGSVTNVATASADGTTSNQDTETVDADQNPELTLDKTADPQTYDAVNDVISYSYLVENTGNVSLAGPVTIDDDIATDEVCPDVSTVGDLDGFLDPGEQITCTASYTITQADLDAGAVTNVATASADGTTSNQDTETVDADQNPELTLDKTADPQTYDAVNDVISYSYLVENTGNVSLAGPVTIDDDIATDEVCPDVNTVGDLDGFLDPGEQITCTASYTITQADLDAGAVTNVATASADGTTSNQDTETVDADQNPELTLDKTADPQTYDAVNDVISYSYLVENTGNVSLAGPVTIDDDIATDEVCPDVSTVGDLDGFLDPGEQITCTASYTITQADLDAGSVTNVATASADGTTSNQDTETVDADQNPELTLDKTADPQTYDAVNDVISYSYLVENTGNVSLAGPVTIDDDIATDEVCPDVSTVGDLDGFLDPGEQITCTASYTITQADLDAGAVTNVATASADGTTSNQDTETVDADQNPELTLDKTADPQTYDAVNDVISYSYLVENTGNVSLAGPVTIDDDIATDEVCPDVSTVGDLDGFLDPGEQITCTASYTITQADLDAGSVTNVATASADGTTSNQDTETVDADQNPELSLTKSASPTTYIAAGQVITYTYVIRNTGNVTLSGPFSITDDKATVTCTQPADGALSPNETMNCTATYTIQPGDLNASGTGSVTNTAVATNGTVTSNQAQATVNQVTTTGQITPTNTSCQDFRDGRAGDLTQILYNVKNNKINNVAPGVLFYYSLVTVPAGTHTISVEQTTSPSFTLFGIQKNQAILWSLNCTKVQSNATGTFTVTNNTETTYIIGIKYAPKTVVGKTKPGGNGQVTYTFTTEIDGAVVPTSPDSLVLKPK